MRHSNSKDYPGFEAWSSGNATVIAGGLMHMATSTAKTDTCGLTLMDLHRITRGPRLALYRFRFHPVVNVIVFSHQFPSEKSPYSGRFVEDQIGACHALGIGFWVVQVVPVPLGKSSFSDFFKSIFTGLILGCGYALTDTGQQNGVLLRSPGFRLGGAFQAITNTAVIWRWLVRSKFPLKNYKLIHAHTALLDGFAAYSISRRTGLPYIVTEHTSPYRSLFRRIGGESLTRLATLHASALVAVSSTLRADILTEFPKAKPRVIGNTFRPDIFKLGEESNYVPFVCDAPISIAWIGSIESRKRLDLAVNVLSSLRSEGYQARLNILSKSQMPDEIRNLIDGLGLSDHVSHYKVDSREVMAAHLEKASVLLVTSTFETFSVAALEAVGSGIPVVSTPCGGPLEILRDQADGIVTHNDTELTLSEAVLDVVTHDSAEARAKRADRARERFGPVSIGMAYVEIYRAVVAKNERVPS